MARPSSAASASGSTALEPYKRKRNFKATPEPTGEAALAASASASSSASSSRRRASMPSSLSFVIQKHWASRLHYDFRLELDGVLLSWAVPKGPSFDPAIKQMAIRVEDHPLDYGGFEGTIPKGNYGAGTVIVWDGGTWEPVGDPHDGLANGKLIFKLHGQKLAGLWELVRISKPGTVKQEQWLLLKKRGDAWARPTSTYDVITALPDSVVERPLGSVEEREPELAGSVALPRLPDDALQAALEAAPKADLPAKVAPQLATLASAPPAGAGWAAETKFDGYRLMARIAGDEVRLFTRNGHDWTARLKPVAREVQTLALGTAWLDGEIVIQGESGVPDFNRLQNAIDNARTAEIVYFVFDLIYFDGRDLAGVPLGTRRSLLERLLDERDSDRVRFSQSLTAPAGQLLQAACQMGLEGIILKRQDAPYVSARTDTWLKLKCMQRQEFVVIGFTARGGAAGEVGALLLGYHENGALRYAGSVGTGWSAKVGRELLQGLTALETDAPAVDPASVAPGRWAKGPTGAKRWVKPTLVVEVAFSEWTPNGHVRHATFKGVRSDKPATAITRERTLAPPAAGHKAAGPAVRIKVSNPERVIDPSTGLTKLDLVRYYQAVADWMLPHLVRRPVSLVRAPQGIAGEHFFQKHAETKMPGLAELDPNLWPGHAALLGIDTPLALVSAAQMNVIEFHTWNSTSRRIDKPDRMIFDLDPGEGVTWERIQEAAILVRTLLDELGLRSWLKTSGGKGLHVIVPLSPRLGYEAVKGFSQAVVQHLARTIPSRFVAKSGAANRVGKTFVDYLRNGHAQTTAAAFSARARPGMGVSMPVSWEKLGALKSASQWSIATAREYLSFQREDPWKEYWTAKQTLTDAMKALGYRPPTK